MKKIGIFGGTFNPIHKGHLHLAQEFSRQLQLDELIFIPTKQPTHKPAWKLASAEHRLAMCRLAAEPLGYRVSDLEIRRTAESYTVLTLRQLKRDYPADRLYLLMGGDMFLTLLDWNSPEEIFSLATLCVAPRSGDPQGRSRLQAYAEQLRLRGARSQIVEMEFVPVSSTAIRLAVEYGKGLEKMVPPEVAEYIRKHHLYLEEEKPMHQVDYQDVIRPFLSEKRFRHSICVAEEAVKLAKQYGADPEKAWTAGILHDILKEVTPDEQLKMMDDFGIILTDIERTAQKLWHAILAPAYMERELGIQDPEILDAVRYHTTARANMTLLDKVLFVADFISADREFEGIEALRAAAANSLDQAIFMGSAFTIQDLAEGHKTIHPDTMAAYNWCILHSGDTRAEQ